ncbi:uncharacterized protein LOC131679408 [Topomyia yanbarensis]|uniref:uncharacterized protein LOC131679408 n=1 Tax=Topomyia yanbarensis TaxID=2498891 RepID=UPI00273B3324|nr:uncharacterized protein LOC131679408 [Topomyia yanbarensis]
MKSIERRFQLDAEFKRQYVSFMHEYIELGHMKEVPANQMQKNSSECYYLPHHAVLKIDSLTKKIRVVFDGLCASSSGVSLNDRLLAGPNNNSDLFAVSLRFRAHRVAFCADVAKMYRQVLVHPADRDFQRIVFREEPDQPMTHYLLCTVTYGTKTAPYWAIECMREAAKPFAAMYPQAVESIKLDFYVDDFLSGADNEEEASCLMHQVVEILSSAGFKLRKWSSNNKNILPNNGQNEDESVPVKMLNDTNAVKALGINWYPSEDEYGFKVNFSPLSDNTKRQMIADSARLIQLHGFSDASEQAYAALNGAFLLTELMQRITEGLSHLAIEHWAWTDSTIVLNWLSAHPRKWKTYVANRTSAILEYLPRSCWNHVISNDSPADLASRGLSPAELVGNPLWFMGTPWLKADQCEWKLCPAPDGQDDDLLETRPVRSHHLVATSIHSNYGIELQLLKRRSSFSLIIRTLAWVNRFIYNLRSIVADRRSLELVPIELRHAKSQLILAVQHSVYAPELELLWKDKSLRFKHVLSFLHTFLEDQGIMRLGGRLQNSSLPNDMKHPVILPHNHEATVLLVRELHLRNFHAGPSLLTSTIYQQYWIVGCQTVVRKVVQGCTRCVRLKGKTASQLMGSLPPARVLATRAFSHVGVDYAGPVKLKATSVRGVKITKGYLVVFVCLSTRAVHLEVANDLSSDTFLGSLKRFISRRGYPVEIRSDNGTNFVGADRKLREHLDQIISHSKDASRYLSNLGIN